MAVPRRRHSKARRNKRRTHYRLRGVEWVKCPDCGEPTLPHRICQNCGKYQGRSYKLVITK